MNDSSTWSPQTGPGFTVKAPNPATIDNVPAHDRHRAFVRYTFHKTELESYIVEITELPADADLGMEVNHMRMRIAAGTQALRSEDYIEEPGINGRDLRYVIDQEDDTLRARSKILGKGNKIFQVRGVADQVDEARQELAEQFVDSFAFTP